MVGSPYREPGAPAPVRQRVRRDRKQTLYALLAVAISIGLFYAKGLIGGPFAIFCAITSAISLQDCAGMVVVGIGGVAVIAALISVGLLMLDCGFCPCPVCGIRLDHLSTFSNDGVCCPHCHQFCEGKRGQLWQTDPERIADSPTFRAPLPHKVRFPKECCLCGKKATRLQHLRVSREKEEWIGYAAADVPVCDECERKWVAKVAPSDMGEMNCIYFSSLPYLRKYCELNGIHPC